MALRYFIFALTVALLSEAAEAQETIKWRLSSQLPISSPVSQGIELWRKRMEEAGKGKIKIETYHNSQLYKDSEVFPAVQNGSIEAGLVIVAQLSAYDPAFGIFDLPGLFRDYAQVQKATNGKLGEMFSERLDKLGVHAMYWPVQGFVEIATVNRDLKSLADFKGLKLRTHSRELARMAQLIGAAPTVIAASEVSTALSRQTIDGLTATLSSYYQRKWSEVAPHATLSHFGVVGVVIIANKGAWSRLPPDLLQAAQAAAKEAEDRSLKDTQREEEEVVAKLRAQNVVFSTFDEKARADFRQATRPMYDEYLKATGAAGKTLVESVESFH